MAVHDHTRTKQYILTDPMQIDFFQHSAWLPSTHNHAATHLRPEALMHQRKQVHEAKAIEEYLMTSLSHP